MWNKFTNIWIIDETGASSTRLKRCNFALLLACPEKSRKTILMAFSFSYDCVAFVGCIRCHSHLACNKLEGGSMKRMYWMQATLPLLRDDLGFDFTRPSFDSSPPRCSESRSTPEAAAPPNGSDMKTISNDGQSNKSGDEIRFDVGLVTAGDSSACIRDAVSGRLKTAVRRASGNRWNIKWLTYINTYT